MSPLNYYEILNSKSTDHIQTIKENYQKLALMHHPDKKLGLQSTSDYDSGAGDKLEEDLFIQINEAWNVLRDPLKRKHYDALMYENEISSHNNVFAELDIKDLSENYENQSIRFWSYQCRCGGSYIIDDLEFLVSHKIVEVECSECSLIIKLSKKL